MAIKTLKDLFNVYDAELDADSYTKFEWHKELLCSSETLQQFFEAFHLDFPSDCVYIDDDGKIEEIISQNPAVNNIGSEKTVKAFIAFFYLNHFDKIEAIKEVNEDILLQAISNQQNTFVTSLAARGNSSDQSFSR